MIASGKVRDAGAGGGSRCVSVTIFRRSRYDRFRFACSNRPSPLCCSRRVAARCDAMRAFIEQGREQYLKRWSHDLHSRNEPAQRGQRRRESGSSMSGPANWTARVHACDTHTRGAHRFERSAPARRLEAATSGRRTLRGRFRALRLPGARPPETGDHAALLTIANPRFSKIASRHDHGTSGRPSAGARTRSRPAGDRGDPPAQRVAERDEVMCRSRSVTEHLTEGGGGDRHRGLPEVLRVFPPGPALPAGPRPSVASASPEAPGQRRLGRTRGRASCRPSAPRTDRSSSPGTRGAGKRA